MDAGTVGDTCGQEEGGWEDSELGKTKRENSSLRSLRAISWIIGWRIGVVLRMALLPPEILK